MPPLWLTITITTDLCYSSEKLKNSTAVFVADLDDWTRIALFKRTDVNEYLVHLKQVILSLLDDVQELKVA